MTTNIGAERIRNNAELKGDVDKLSTREYQQFISAMDLELLNEFRPEFINRIEHKIIFKMLDKPVIKQIALKNLEILNQRMLKQGAYIVFDKKLLDYLADNGTDVNNGARPLARLINRKVLAPIARRMVKLNRKKGYLHEFKIIVKGNAPNGIDELIDKRSLDFQVTLKQIKTKK